MKQSSELDSVITLLRRQPWSSKALEIHVSQLVFMAMILYLFVRHFRVTPLRMNIRNNTGNVSQNEPEKDIS